jgi:hypothetical protein
MVLLIMSMVISLLSLTCHVLKYLTTLLLPMVIRHRLLVLAKLHLCYLYPRIICYMYLFFFISISKHTCSHNCSITFSSGSFFIQDQSTRKTIRTGSESQGLYYPHPSTVCGFELLKASFLRYQ